MSPFGPAVSFTALTLVLLLMRFNCDTEQSQQPDLLYAAQLSTPTTDPTDDLSEESSWRIYTSWKKHRDFEVDTVACSRLFSSLFDYSAAGRTLLQRQAQGRLYNWWIYTYKEVGLLGQEGMAERGTLWRMFSQPAERTSLEPYAISVNCFLGFIGLALHI